MFISIIFRLVQLQCTNILECYSMISYEHHLKFVLNKVQKIIDLLRKFQQILQKQYLIAICKSFIRPHLDYDNTVYDRAFNESFHKNLAITGGIRGTSSKKFFQELGLKSLTSRRLFYKIFHEKSPWYLFQLIP